MFCTNAFPPLPGGVATFSHDLVDLLRDMGHNVVLVYDKDCETQDYYHNKTDWGIKIPQGHLSHLFRLTQAFRCAARVKPHVIFVTSWRQYGISACLLKFLFGIPYIVQVHGTEITPPCLRGWRRKIAHFVFGNSHYAMPNSQFTSTLVTQIFGVNTPLHIIRPFISPTLEKIISGLRVEKNGPSCTVPKIVCVGNLIQRKGFDIVLKALAKIKDESWTCTIIGSGPQELTLKKLINDLGISKRVILMGQLPREEVLYHINQAYVFVLTSLPVPDDIESFGIVYIEAQCLGVPCIANPIYGVPEAVVNGEGGLFIDPDNPLETTASALQRFLKDSEFRDEQARLGHARIKKYFAHEQRKIEIQALLKNLISERPPEHIP